MKIIECEQGTPEWFEARLGIPSASNFDKIVTTKGIRSKSAEKYMYQLAGEKIFGDKEETYKSAAMERGTELESEAREFYELISGNSVTEVGFCLADGFGCSPDGLIGDDGGLEIKCPSIAVHVSYLLGGEIPTDYIQQVQGNMLVTGRVWWDFLSYYPGLKPLLVRVPRDNDFCDKLETELKKFLVELEDVKSKIIG